MRLRRVVVSGFKTFASRTEVTFDRGITAIVGPNGSGKSNLVDAVRWALGETNARELRGQRMDEVVYAGGGRRQRVNLAEVEIVIDNEEGRLATEDPEVAVTRRVVRAAHDTEFRINGERVRLRDLERLLGNTGLTQNGYAVVAQNDIDSIIEASPAQRRALVEQAAGVRGLRAACEETLSRLGRAEIALSRMHDLLGDAEPRLEELAQQATAALEQRDATTRLAELRGSLAREEWRAASGGLKQARRRLEQASSRLEAATEADAAFAGRAGAERQRLELARAARDDAAARLEEARLSVERADGEARRLADRLRSAVLQRAIANAELESARSDLLAVEPAQHVPPSEPDGERAAPASDGGPGPSAADADDAFARAQAAVDHAWDEVNAAQADVDATSEKARSALAEAAMLHGLVAGAIGAEGGVARAVAEGSLNGRRLVDSISVRDERDATAVAAALEGHLGAWLVDDVDGAAEYLDTAGPREELFALSHTLPGAAGRVPAPWRSAASGIDASPDALDAIIRLLDGVWFADSLESGRAALAAGARVAVLPDGRVVSVAGIRGGGRPAEPLELVAREREAKRRAEAAAAEASAAIAGAGDARRRLEQAAAAARAAGGAAAETRQRVLTEIDAARRRGSLAQPSQETDRLMESARARVAAAELRVVDAESYALAALVMGRAARGSAVVERAAVDVARAALDASSVPLPDLERAVIALEAEHAEVAVSMARAEDERTAALAEVSDAEASVARLAEAVRGEADDDAVEWDPQAMDRAEREIVRLERRITALGLVNALAPEQHASLEARVTAVRIHRDDIGAACDDIHTLTRRLAGDLERRFDAVFGAVSFHFQQLFAELFPGGKATLRLEEPVVDDADEESIAEVAERRPGVEILAQPPGKRLCPLRLLSGGERSMTALATVLALQQVNPSPFYVFDEVDAALDDSNVVRFTRLLRRLAELQQFIIVTHNHITMAAADILWGVTIDADGVSSVLGVRFEADVQLEGGVVVGLRRAESRAAG